MQSEIPKRKVGQLSAGNSATCCVATITTEWTRERKKNRSGDNQEVIQIGFVLFSTLLHLELGACCEFLSDQFGLSACFWGRSSLKLSPFIESGKTSGSAAAPGAEVCRLLSSIKWYQVVPPFRRFNAPLQGVYPQWVDVCLNASDRGVFEMFCNDLLYFGV